MAMDEWDGYYGDLDWQLQRRNFKNYTGLQLLQHLAVDSRISFFGPEARTKLQGRAVGQPDTVVNASQSSSVGTKLSVAWDGNPMTLTSVLREITEMSMVSLPKMKGSFAGDNKVPDLTTQSLFEH